MSVLHRPQRPSRAWLAGSASRVAGVERDAAKSREWLEGWDYRHDELNRRAALKSEAQA